MVCVLSGDSGPFTPFSLIPFPGSPSLESRVSGRVARKGSDLICRFEVEGVADLEVPSPAPEPERRDEMWRETCLELFLGRLQESREPRAPEYWEVNLSPAGHWNVYRFSDHREGRAEEEAVAFLPLLVLPEADRLVLDVVLDLSALGLAEGDLEVGFSAVLVTEAGETHHHALAHPRAAEGRPDFHDREGWTVRLGPPPLAASSHR